MIMQEFETRRMKTNQINPTDFDNVPIKICARINLGKSTSSETVSETALIQKNRQTPFPYLKRKSIRVDVVLKKQQALNKNSQKVKQANNRQEKLRKEKKLLETENAKLKGKLSQMEKMFTEMRSFYHEMLQNQSQKKVAFTNQECQTEKSTAKRDLPNFKKVNKNTRVECSKCHQCMESKYMKYHERVCGNTQLTRLLSEKDLKTLESIRNQKQGNSVSPKKNQWRKNRQEFLKQIKNAKTGTNDCIIFYKSSNFRK